jgi:HSP20 family protein
MTKTTVAPRQSETGVMTRWPFFELSNLFRWPESFFGPLREVPMRIEEFLEDGTMVVRAELPGVDPDKDVEIYVTEGMLHIRAERQQESQVEEKGSYRSEMHYGIYSRTIPLPEGASEKDVAATYKDGILEVRLPVGAQAKRQRIPVNHS